MLGKARVCSTESVSRAMLCELTDYTNRPYPWSTSLHLQVHSLHQVSNLNSFSQKSKDSSANGSILLHREREQMRTFSSREKSWLPCFKAAHHPALLTTV